MRWWRMAMVALLIVAGAGLAPGRVPGAAAVGVWMQTAAPPEGTGSDAGRLTVLPDGRVLLTRLGAVGQEPRAIAGLFDPARGEWAMVPALDARSGYDVPVLLRDGRVLVSGGGSDNAGSSESGFLAGGAQLYTPATNSWAQTGSLVQARTMHTATVLNDGSVLVVGGRTGTKYGEHQGLASAERYDPSSGKWSLAGALAGPRIGHTATLLPDGRVLVVGGREGDHADGRNRAVLSAELYNPATGQWTLAATPLWTHGAGASATLLADGRMLVAGGDATSGSRPAALTVAEIYDPAKNSWDVIAPLRQGVYGHSALLLPDGRVLAIGGGGYSTQIYDPVRDLWTLDATEPYTIGGVATTLRDGRIILVGSRIAALYTPMSADRTCFSQTSKCVAEPFLAYWQAHGGLALNGYPLSDEQVEILEDGQAYTVQYFERSRLEYHPENYDPQFQVLLGQFGRRMLGVAYGEYSNYGGYQQAIKSAAPLDGARYFPETGHNLGGRFLAYWEAHGGLAQFGLPLTEERWDTLPSDAGACCQTQYFERARFEYHPENDGTPYEVLLGQFGRQILTDNAMLSGGFGRLYLTKARVRDRLGAPRGPQVTVPGAAQSFENGLMVWRGDLKRIFVFVGTPMEGSLAVGNQGYGSDVTWPDTWDAGQDPGGGAAPAPDLFLPQRGFGKLWREQNFRNSLGYATTPDEQAFTMTIQEFAAGWLLTTDGPGGHAIYAMYLQAVGSHGSQRVGEYERFVSR